MIAPRCMVVRIAVKRHAPQQMWPQGVSVAFVGGKKQIGQVYSDRSSASGSGGGWATGGLLEADVEVEVEATGKGLGERGFCGSTLVV